MNRDCANITEIGRQKQAELRDHRRDLVCCAQAERSAKNAMFAQPS